MPTKNATTEFWVKGLRQQLKLTEKVGSSYRISQQSGKCKLDVRYKDNSRSYATLPIDWLPANARRIEETVIAIAQYVAAGKTLKQAVQILFGGNQVAPEPTEDASIVDLVKSFDVIGEEKITDNKIKQSTWDGFYKKIRNKLIYVLSNNEVNNAKTLLKLLATVEMPNSKPNLHKGTRTRQQVIGAVSTWLEYATEKEEFEEGYLNPKFWTPPKAGSKAKKALMGHHSKKRKAIPIYDEEFIKLIDELKNQREKKAADRYIYLIQLCNVFGIRPHEANHLRVETINNKKSVFCGISKRTGGGSSPEDRELYALHQYWEKEFELIEKLENNYSVPPVGDQGLGDALGKYLAKVDYWNHLRETRGLTPYSMRHGYAYRMHQDARYSSKISTRMGAALMGHSHSIHLDTYGMWTPQGSMRNTLDNLLNS